MKKLNGHNFNFYLLRAFIILGEQLFLVQLSLHLMILLKYPGFATIEDWILWINIKFSMSAKISSLFFYENILGAINYYVDTFT